MGEGTVGLEPNKIFAVRTQEVTNPETSGTRVVLTLNHNA